MKLPRKTHRAVQSLILALLVMLIGFLSEHWQPFQKTAVQLSPGTYQVVGFNDGDTISVRIDGNDETVRFIGVDTPETQDPRKPVQCFGKAASEFTKKLIGNQPVRLETDPLSSTRDRYNRLLRYVYLPDGRLVQAEIIKAGYGFAYTSFPFTKSEEFLNLQREAREQGNGLWTECSPATNQYGGFTSDAATD